jgi:hypothetical protein
MAMAPSVLVTRKMPSTKKPSSRKPRASAVDVHQLVQVEAYLIAEARGFAPGHELADWLEAERRVTSRSDARTAQ